MLENRYLGAEEIRPGFCLGGRVRLIRGTVECFGRFVVRIDWKIVSYLAREADQRRDGCLLCLTGQTVIL